MPNLRSRSNANCPSSNWTAGHLSIEPLEDRTFLAGDMVLAWNEVILDAIRMDRTAPPLAARELAIMHIAMYDAVNSIQSTHEPYLVRSRGPRDASTDAAISAAAHATLVELFPAQAAQFDEVLADALAAIPNGRAENQGVAVGRSVARQVLALRRHDGSGEQVSYSIGSEPGDWQPTPPAYQATPALVQWPELIPFALETGSQFRPAPPPAMTGPEYAAAFHEVWEIGGVSSLTRTQDQTEIARFWINGPGTATPPGHWNLIAQSVAESEGNTVAKNARLFALLNIALADAGIVSWDAKYEYNYWRPVTAIHAADTDGNLNTAADTTWTPLIPTPAFPAYTSGHSTFSAAGAAVLAGFFGSDQVVFNVTSENPLASDRTFSSFSQAAEESGVSRIYGGIHWNFDNLQGLHSGQALGEFVVNGFLRPRTPAPASEAVQAPALFASAGPNLRHIPISTGSQNGAAVPSSFHALPKSPNSSSKAGSIADGPRDLVIYDERLGVGDFEVKTSQPEEPKGLIQLASGPSRRLT